MLASVLLFALLGSVQSQQRIASTAVAVQVRPVPDEAVRQNARLAAKLAPSAKTKVQAAAAELADTAKRKPAMTPAQLQSSARTSVVQAFPGLTGADIEAVVFLVMMQAAQDQQADLQQAMRQTQQNTLAKQAARAQGQASSAAQANSAPQMSDASEMQSIQLQMLMDQRSKLLEVISNVMKSASDTQSAIVANLK